jgi:hypothetical protein
MTRLFKLSTMDRNGIGLDNDRYLSTMDRDSIGLDTDKVVYTSL